MMRDTGMLLLAALLTPAVQAFDAPPGCARVAGTVEPLALAAPAEPGFLPAQLEIRTPLEPTAFPSGGHDYLVYELHLRNHAGDPVELQGIEVIAGDSGQPLATFDAAQLGALLSPRDPPAGDEARQARQLAAGQGTVAYLCLAFAPGVVVPATLRHRVLLPDIRAEGPAIGTRHTPLPTFAPPVAGPGWIAAGGPGNTSHHRAGLLVIGGAATISRRYAIDWRQQRDGASFIGDPLEPASHLAYGEPVYALADGIVVAARDGLPDNVPRTANGFATALPVTMETIAGNSLTLDLGDGRFALYAHLAPGSVRVKAGERVARGQVLGRIGNSGDAREPHLHLEVTDSPVLLAGEGLPYVIDRYELRRPEGRAETRTGELPLLDMPVDFASRGTTSD